MSVLHHETLLETIYDEVWIEYRNKNNLTDDQLYALEQNSKTGTIPDIEIETTKRFEDLCQWAKWNLWLKCYQTGAL